MRHRRVLSLHRPAVGGELLEGAREGIGVAGGERPGRIGEVLALARDRRLHDRRDERGDDQRDEAEDEHDRVAAAVVVVVAVAAEEGEPQEHVGEEPHGDDKPEDDHRQTDVVVLHVSELVGHDALEFRVVHDLEEAGGRRDDRVLRVAPGREGVRCRILDDVDLRHRGAGRDGEVLDDAVEPRVVALLDLVRAAHRERLAARRKVLDERIDRRDDDRDDGDRRIVVDVPRECTEPADDDQEEDDDQDGVALVGGYRAIHGCDPGLCVGASGAERMIRTGRAAARRSRRGRRPRRSRAR